MNSARFFRLFTVIVVFLSIGHLRAAEERLTSPDGKLSVSVSDDDGVRFTVVFDGIKVITDSRLGLAFQDGSSIGPKSRIVATHPGKHDGTWENPFGKRRIVSDRYRQLSIELAENAEPATHYTLIFRAYDDGLAFRYELPKESGSENPVLTKELTEFKFVGDFRCWAGEESVCAENHYLERRLTTIPIKTSDRNRPDGPYLSVLPLLVEAQNCFVAISESDLLDWAGMFVTGSGSTTVNVNLAPRADKNGLAVLSSSCASPWRVMMIGRRAADLVNSDLISTLATPNRLGDVSWVKPGISAWDAWWTGVNPSLPQFTGVNARGDTRSHEEYIDFAAEMGWPYQLVDWYWYKNDPLTPLPHVDLPAVFSHAKEKGVRMFVWVHSKDLKRVGLDKVFSTIAEWGAAGVKIDFMNSDSQETVNWYTSVLETAAKYHLMVDFHGAYKPTGLTRTYPNYITQEGVLGNEYNKLPGNRCTPQHMIMLPFTRGLLGPMDFTPGGFLNRNVEDFKITYPTEVMGTRARQLAMTVIYLSPLLVLCDSPDNYRGQAGVEFFRDLPTVWDDTVVLNAEVGKSLVVARRSGDRWYLAAMNDDVAEEIAVPLSFLGQGPWTLRSFADAPNDGPAMVAEESSKVSSSTVVKLSLARAGGYAGIIVSSR